MFPESQLPSPAAHPAAPGPLHVATAAGRLAAWAAAAITNNSNTTNPTQNPPLTPRATSNFRPPCLTTFFAARFATALDARPPPVDGWST
jgi:hypothetical protein